MGGAAHAVRAWGAPAGRSRELAAKKKTNRTQVTGYVPRGGSWTSGCRARARVKSPRSVSDGHLHFCLRQAFSVPQA